MALKAVSIGACPSPPHLDVGAANSHAALIGNLRYDFDKCRKWECCRLGFLAPKATTAVADEIPSVVPPSVHPSGVSDGLHQNESKGFHKDINLLPNSQDRKRALLQVGREEGDDLPHTKLKSHPLSLPPEPLTLTDISSSPKDGSKVQVAYQGLPGAYSEDAALKAYPKCVTVPCDNFEAAFKAVELWLVDKAVLPIENSVGGSIHRNYDLLLRHRLHIVGEVQMHVNHCLLGLPGVRKEELQAVVSHPQALAQCGTLLSNLGVVKISASDTASAAQWPQNVQGTLELLQVPELEKYMGLTFLQKDSRQDFLYMLCKIELLEYIASADDDDENITRFLILAREPRIPGTDRPYKTSIVFSLEEGPGVLFKALAVFAMRDINLLKIESRPLKQRPVRVVDDSNQGTAKYFDYLFYIDIEASMAEPRAQYALGQLQEFARFLRVLGCYPIDTTV
ncbi:hypothetical protein Fmac_013642 [Flemingia macrophylla]|uniref:arogenate dehydratase n=1 Tax=Flemingia macrophylla TaxID=520843 RepID=A0ABD1MU78_9FABA